MRVVEVRRHTLSKKGTARGAGSHISQAGVDLVRRVATEMGPFDHVVASPVPRAPETAIAMGYAVDRLDERFGPSDPALFAEMGHHDRWHWPDPFAEFARLVRQGGATARLGQLQVDGWHEAARALPEGGRALVVSHGRAIECGLVTCFPEADHGRWGVPFRHCEGIRLRFDGEDVVAVELLRVWEWDFPAGPSR